MKKLESMRIIVIIILTLLVMAQAWNLKEYKDRLESKDRVIRYYMDDIHEKDQTIYELQLELELHRVPNG